MNCMSRDYAVVNANEKHPPAKSIEAHANEIVLRDSLREIPKVERPFRVGFSVCWRRRTMIVEDPVIAIEDGIVRIDTCKLHREIVKAA